MKTHSSSTKRERVADMLWRLLAKWDQAQQEVIAGIVPAETELGCLAETLLADFGFILGEDAFRRGVIACRDVKPEAFFANPASIGLDAEPSGWRIPADSRLFDDGGLVYKLYEREDLAEPEDPAWMGANTVIRAHRRRQGRSCYLFLAWRNPATEIVPFDRALIVLWQALLEALDARNLQLHEQLAGMAEKLRELSEHIADLTARREVSTIEAADAIADSLRRWAESHRNPDAPLLVVGHTSYSPKQIADEVARATRFGMEIRQEIVRAAANVVLPGHRGHSG